MTTHKIKKNIGFEYNSLKDLLKNNYNNRIVYNTSFKLKKNDKNYNYNETDYKKAAVLCVLVPNNKKDDLEIILTLRSSKLKDHSGQVSFPGGKMDNSDKNYIECAKRETKEEIGLDLKQLKIIGKMNKYITGTGFIIQPIVGYIEKKIKLKPNFQEVEEIFYFPVKHLYKKENIITSYYFNSNKCKYFYYDFIWNNYRIWGTTAMILYDVIKNIKEVMSYND